MRRKLWLVTGWLATLALTTTIAQTMEEPPAPKPSNAVQKILDEAGQLAQAKQLENARQTADRALQVARAEKDAVGEAQARRLRAQTLQDLGRTVEAITAWQETAAAWALAGDGAGRVEALAAAGLLLVNQKPDEANALLAQALALTRAESRRPLAAARALMAAGHSYRGHGRLNQAHEFYTAALALWEKWAPNSLDVATSLTALGTLAWWRRDLAAAKTYYQRALAIREQQAPGSLDVAASLGSLGNLAGQQGDLAAAKDYHQRALAIREQQAPGSLDLARSLNNLGSVVRQQGDLTAAKDYHQRALAIREQQAPDSLDVASSLHNLGVVAGWQGNPGAARNYHQRALAIQEQQAPGSLVMATSLDSLGNVASGQGDLAAAKDYYQRALAIREQQAPGSLDVARSLNSLGNVAYRQGDWATAKDYHQQALAIKEKQAPGSLSAAASLGNLGLVAYQRRDWAAAKDYHQRALAIQEQQAPGSLDVAMSLNNLGLVAQEQGDLVAAKDYHQRALAIQEQQAPGSLSAAVSLGNLGLVASRQADWSAAERWVARAWQVVRQQAVTVIGDEARQAFEGSTISYAEKLLGYQIAQGKLALAFQTWEESRAQALEQLLLERSAIGEAVGGSRWSAYQRAVAARDRAEAALSRASALEAQARRALATLRPEDRAAPTRVAKAQDTLKTATQKLEDGQSAYTQARVQADQLWADLKKSAPRTFARPLPLEQAQQALPAGTLLVAFSVGEERTHVFLLQAGDHRDSPLTAYPVAIPRRQWQDWVHQFRRQITEPAQRSAGPRLSRQLFATLFPPAAQPAIRRAARLLISPDGPLWDLSFAALVTNTVGPPHYLAEDKPLTYTRSLSQFAQSRHDPPPLAKGSPPSVLVMGNPLFNRQAATPVAMASQKYSTHGERSYLCWGDGQPAPPLPSTAIEATRIARLYKATPLLGEQATEAALRQRIETADVIHLATHGCPHPTRAMSAGILLTPPEKEPAAGETRNDGVLQAWEIHSQLKLRAELVVLSTCESGQGEIKPGEGLVGLTRALQYAGARSIVVSQWAVDDQSTTELMMAFHQYLRQGLAKDDALRRAMARVRQQPRTAAPYYWAAFFLMGDPDNPNLGMRAGP